MKHAGFRLTALAALVLAFAQQAQAAGTLAGTDISNQATVDFEVGGVNQDDVDSNTVTFETDNRVNLTVAELGGAATDVVPGETGMVLAFSVTNNGNAPQDFRLSASNFSGSSGPFGGTDNFDPGSYTVVVDDGDGLYEAAEDTATFLDELAPDDDALVFIVASIPSGADDEDVAALTLTAIAAEADGTGGSLGADLVETTGPESPTTIDIVFGDVDGYADDDRDGMHSDADQYDVVTATIEVNKTSVVISDPFNDTTDPKAIPGAVIEYCIQVSNTGSSTATDIVTSDDIPANTSYVAGSIFTGGTVTAGECNADGDAEDDDATDADESDATGGAYASGTVTTTIPSIAAGSTVTSRFRVTIQ